MTGVRIATIVMLVWLSVRTAEGTDHFVSFLFTLHVQVFHLQVTEVQGVLSQRDSGSKRGNSAVASFLGAVISHQSNNLVHNEIWNKIRFFRKCKLLM